MRLVHSLWTKPMFNNAREVKSHKQIITTLWCHASSVAYAKGLGLPIVLHADNFARKLLDYLPYDEIIPLHVPDYAPTCLWAAGKFFALQNMELQDVHIDGDVFIKTHLLAMRIDYGVSHSDLIIQSVEDKQHTLNDYYTNCAYLADKYKIDFINGANNSHGPAYNCGLVGFNNQTLKNLYLANYLHCHKQMAENEEAIDECLKLKTWPDLLFEQKNLYDIALGYDVFNVLGTGKEAYKTALQYGYQHILGSTKWSMLDDIKRQLYTINPIIFRQTNEHLDEILASL